MYDFTKKNKKFMCKSMISKNDLKGDLVSSGWAMRDNI